MNEVILPQGSDQEFTITCKDEDGVAIDFSAGFQNIVIIVYNQDKTILEKYSKVTTAGWKAIGFTDWATGRLSFKLTTDITNLAVPGKKLFEIRVQKTDVTLADTLYDTIVNEKYLCTITKSLTSILTLP